MRIHRRTSLLLLAAVALSTLLAPCAGGRTLTLAEKERLAAGTLAVRHLDATVNVNVEAADNGQVTTTATVGSIPKAILGALLGRKRGASGSTTRPKLNTGTSPGFMPPLTNKIPSYAPKSIAYKNGPVMNRPIEVYLIWHGTWTDAQKEPIQTFVASIAEETIANKPGSVKDWWNTNRLYKAGATYVTPEVSLSTTDIDIAAASSAAGQPPLTRTDIKNLISFQLLSGALPRLESAIYAVFTSADVDVDGYCTDYCAYHDTSGNWKYTWVGMPEKCLVKCTHEAANGLDYPNGDRALDGLISNFGHVLSETVTNPRMNSWSDQRGNENMDLCLDNWGTEYLTDDATPVQYNAVVKDDSKFFLPTNLNPTTGICVNGISVLPGKCGKELFGYPCDVGA